MIPPDKELNIRSQKPRRFIAGAICPECLALDRLVVETNGTGETQCCVNCGYQSVQPSSRENSDANKKDVQRLQIPPAIESEVGAKPPKKVP